MKKNIEFRFGTFPGNKSIDFKRSEKTVRINSLTSNICHLDIEGIFKGLPISNLPSSIHLPKGKERPMIFVNDVKVSFSYIRSLI